MAGIFSTWVQYPVDVTKDLLLIYNTNSPDSRFVKDYYLVVFGLAIWLCVMGMPEGLAGLGSRLFKRRSPAA